jgi:hypothetical protein
VVQGSGRGACDHSQAWFERHAEALAGRCLKNESFAARRSEIDIGRFGPTDGGWAAEKCGDLRVSSCAAVIPSSGTVAEKLEFLMQRSLSPDGQVHSLIGKSTQCLSSRRLLNFAD